MLQINEKFGLNIPDSRNIDIMALVDVTKKDKTIVKEWQVYGHVGRNIKAAVDALLEANVMHSDVKYLWELADMQRSFINSIDIAEISNMDMQYTIDAQAKKIMQLEKMLRDLKGETK